MGIYDRDYMRRRDSESQDSNGTFAMKGVVLAILIVGGIFALVNRGRVELEERQHEKDVEQEYLRLLELQIERLKPTGDPPPMLLRPMNVNTATVEELDAIPHVTRNQAEGIVAYGVLHGHRGTGQGARYRKGDDRANASFRDGRMKDGFSEAERDAPWTDWSRMLQLRCKRHARAL